MSPEERSPEQIRADIDKTRAELGDTVEALAEKTDVKARAKAKAEEVKARAKAAAPESPQEAQALVRRNPRPFAIGAAALLLFILWRRRRS
ncbi:MAG: DUF3618 domain-containing protein [Actinobacteria bacterium]|nr:DUF3618 domain-containing protein [Actinomycetota bacterium]